MNKALYKSLNNQFALTIWGKMDSHRSPSSSFIEGARSSGGASRHDSPALQIPEPVIMRREGEPPFLFFVDTTQRSIVRHTDLETLVNDYDIASLEKPAT